jgi:hypothetical protein
MKLTDYARDFKTLKSFHGLGLGLENRTNRTPLKRRLHLRRFKNTW